MGVMCVSASNTVLWKLDNGLWGPERGYEGDVYYANLANYEKDEDGNLKQGEYEQAIEDKRDLIVDGLVDLLGLNEDRLRQRIENTDSAYEPLAYELEEEETTAVREFIKENKLSSTPTPRWAPISWASWPIPRTAAA